MRWNWALSAFCADDPMPFSSSSTNVCQSRTFSRYERRSSSSIDRLGSFDRSRESYGARGAQVALGHGGPDPALDAGQGPRKANGTRARPRSGRPSWPGPAGHYTAARAHLWSRFLLPRRTCPFRASAGRTSSIAGVWTSAQPGAPPCACARFELDPRWRGPPHGDRIDPAVDPLQDPTRCGGARCGPEPPASSTDYWSEPPTRRAISCDCAHWSAKFLAAAPLQVIFQNDWSCWTASFFFGGFSSA